MKPVPQNRIINEDEYLTEKEDEEGGEGEGEDELF